MARSIVRTVGMLVAVGALAACEGDQGPMGPAGDDGADGATGPQEPAGPQGPPGATSFGATLDGENEVPARTTTATGTATLALVGDILLYRVNVTGITNVTLAHIHGPALAGANASVVLNLCGTSDTPACPTGAPFSGVLASGFATTTSASAVSFDSLVVLLNNGNAYVNVHTNDPATDPSNTGPGDYPGGELRGQVAVQ